jgi:hypothetical protein
VLFDEVCEMKRAGQARRASTDDQDVRLQLFPLDRHAIIVAGRRASVRQDAPPKVDFPGDAGP